MGFLHLFISDLKIFESNNNDPLLSFNRNWVFDLIIWTPFKCNIDGTYIYSRTTSVCVYLATTAPTARTISTTARAGHARTTRRVTTWWTPTAATAPPPASRDPTASRILTSVWETLVWTGRGVMTRGETIHVSARATTAERIVKERIRARRWVVFVIFSQADTTIGGCSEYLANLMFTKRSVHEHLLLVVLIQNSNILKKDNIIPMLKDRRK